MKKMKEKQIAYVVFVDLEKGDHRGDRGFVLQKLNIYGIKAIVFF